VPKTSAAEGKDDAGMVEERRLRIEQQRHRFRFAIGIVALIVLMYFVVAPISAAYGQPLALPQLELVVIILTLVSFSAFGVRLSAAEILGKLGTGLSRVKISLGPTTATGVTKGDGDGDTPQ
jgi:hypothetical protein